MKHFLFSSKILVCLILLFTLGSLPSVAQISISEDFDYGSSSGNLNGLNGGSGFSGAWSGGTGGYLSTGLSFGLMSSPGGAMSGSGFFREITTGFDAAGPVSGSFLFQMTSASNSVEMIGLGSSTSWNNQNHYIGLMPANDGQFGLPALGIRGTGISGMTSGASLTQGTTYMYAFSYDNSSTSAWILSLAQYNNFFNGTTLNQTAMNAASIGTGATNVTGKVTLATSASSLVTMNYIYSYWFGGGSMTVDRIRMSGTAALTGLESAAPGAALNFDGVDDYITTTIPTLPIGSSSRTLECWVKVNSFSYSNHVVGWGSYSANQDEFRIGYDHDKHFFVWGNNADIGSSTNFNLGQWYHVATTYDGTDLKLYVNGVLEGSLATTLATTLTDFTIGDNPISWMSNLDGTIDEVRIWNRALSACELGNKLNCEPSVSSQTGLIAMYHFNQGVAGGTNSTTTLTDATGNYNATLMNFGLTGSNSNWVTSGGVVTGASCSSPFSGISVKGNNTVISSGSTSPLTSDHTDFGAVALGSSFTRTFTISNTGASNIDISSISSSNGSFSISNVPTVVPANNSVTFNVTFNSSLTGLQTSTITVSLSGCGIQNYNFNVQAMTPFTIGFGCYSGALGNYYNGGTGPNVGVEFTTGLAGGGLLNATANPVLNVPAGFTGGFSVYSHNLIGFRIRVFDGLDNTGTQIATQDFVCNGCGGSVTFSGVAKSVRLERFSGPVGYDNLTFGSTTIGTPIIENYSDINLQGNGITILDGTTTTSTTNNTDFGSIAVGSSVVKTFTIQNVGLAALSITSITSSNAAMVVSGAPTSIPANGSATFDITFTPTTTGANNATIIINNDDCDEAAYDFAVTGIGSCTMPAFTSCPTNQSANTSSSSCDAVVTYSSLPVASGAPSPTYTYSFSGATTGSGSGTGSGLTFNKGTTTVTVTATNSCGSITCSFDVVVTDNVAPTVTCPSNVTINNTANLCTGTTTLNVPTFSDNCISLGNALDYGNGGAQVSPGEVNELSNLSGMTLETWIYPTSNAVDFRLYQISWTPAFAYFIRSTTGVATFGMSSGSFSTAANVIPINTWTHVAVVFDGTQTGNNQVKMYVNGDLITGTYSGSWTTTTQSSGHINLRVGTDAGGGSNVRGKLDEFRVWTTARSAAQIKANYTKELSAQTNLTLLYHFNQGTAYGNNTAITTITDDATGSTHPGSMAGFTKTGLISNFVSHSVVLTNNAPTTYPIGNTTVTWTAKDESNNVSTCTQVVTMNDTQVPTLVAPSNQTLTTITNTCAANYTIADPITDNCTGSFWGYSTTGATTLTSSGNTKADGTTSGALSFNKGVTIVTLTGIDAGSNLATSTTFTVTVNDTQIPTISGCPTNQSLNTSAVSCTASYAIPSPTIADNCAGPYTWNASFSGNAIGNPTNLTGLASGVASSAVSFNKGTTTVTLNGVDASGNISSACTFTVTVTDNQAPTISGCPSNQSINVATNLCTATYVIPAPTITDNCTGTYTWRASFSGNAIGNPTNLTNLVNGTATSAITFNKGATTVTLNAVDANNNVSAGCTFTVTVVDNQAPNFASSGLTSPPASALSNVPEASQYQVVYQLDMGTNADYNNTAVPYTINNSATTGVNFTRVAYLMELDNKWVWVSMNKFNAGQTLTQLGIPNAAFNNVTYQQTVSNMNVYSSAGSGVTNGTGLNGNVEMWSNCYTTSLGLGGIGGDANTYDFNDATATISCYGSFQVHNYSIGQTIFAYNAFDEPTIDEMGIGNQVGGSNNPDWTFAHNATSYTTRKLYILVNSSNCPSNITANNTTGQCGATVTYTTPTATDNCSGTITVTQTAGLASGSSFPKGTTTNSFVATDISGNTSTCSFDVTVNDTQAPTLLAPGNQNINVVANTCAANYTITDPITDNCTGATWGYTLSGATTGTATGIADGTNSSSISFNKGTTTVTLSGIDASSNVATTAAFTVTVADNQAPTLACASDVTISNTAGLCTGTTSLTYPTISDNCTGAMGNALNFDGTNDLALVYNSGLSLANTSFTVEFWSKRATTGTGDYIFSQGGTLDNNQTLHIGYRNTNEFTFAFYNNDINAPLSYSDLNWHHWACTFDNTTKVQTVYRDGAAIAQRVSSSSFLGSGNTHLYIGDAAYGGNIFGGSLDELRVWTTARTQAQIIQNMSVELTGTPAGLAYYYKFNQGTANGTNTGVTTVTPTIGGVSGTLSNFALNGTSSNWVGGVSYPLVGYNGLLTYPKGNTNVTWTATDASGNTSTCTQLVTVNDTQLPTLSNPGNQSFVVATNSCAASYTIVDPISDNCTGATWGYTLSGATTATVTGIADGTNSASISFNAGITTVTLTGVDASSNNAITVSFDVTVTDNIPPSISCISNFTTVVDPGQCSAVVSYTAPIGTDNCAGATTTQTAGLPSGSAFPVGTTTNTFQVTDAAGNHTSCSFTVTVNDNENPTISCQSNITTNVDPNQCTAVVTYTAPVGTDNCPGAATVQTAGWPSGFAFPVGTTTNTFRVTDAYGNIAQCSFNVVVNDNIYPTISCPSNISRNVDAGQCSAVVTYTAPVGSDNCLGAITTQTSGLASGAAFPVGTTTNTFKVTDASGNETTCSFTVTVTDNKVPVITCPSNISVPATSISGAVVTYTAPVGSDNCPGATTNLIGGFASGSTFPLGTTTVTYEVTDASSNTASCSFDVTVSGLAPSIVCPSTITVNNTPGSCDALVNFAATETTGVPASTITYSIAPGSVFPKGTTSVTATATNAIGTSSCTFDIVVADNEAPVVTPLSNQTLYSTSGSCEASMIITDPLSDNCNGATWGYTLSGATTGSVTGIADGTNSSSITFNKGKTTVTLSGVDNAAVPNSGINTSFTVTVLDTVKPIITCAAPVTINNTPGLCTGTTTLTPPTVTDNCPLQLGNALHFDGNNDLISASGLLATAPSEFTVEFWLKPSSLSNYNQEISIGTSANGAWNGFTFHSTGAGEVYVGTNIGDRMTPAEIPANTVQLNTWQHFAYTYSGGLGKFYKNGNLIATKANSAPANFDFLRIGSGCCNPISGSLDELRIWNIAKTQTQIQNFRNVELSGAESNLVAYYNFNQGIANGTNTGITTLNDLATTIGGANNGAMTGFALNGNTSNWVDGVPLTSLTNNAPSVYPNGNTTVIWTATDASGNTSTCSQVVTVVDNEIPVLVAPANQSLNVITNSCAANYTITDPITDNCNGATWGYTLSGATTGTVTGIADGLNSASISFNTGITTVTLTGDDASSNSAISTSFTVTVIDNIYPTITCLSNISTNVDAGQCGAVVTFTAPVGTDNCAGATTTQTAGLPSGSSFPVGTTTNTFRVTDAAGNFTDCSFDVIVIDNISPSITCLSNISANVDAGQCSAVVNFTAPVGTDNCAGSTTTQTAGLSSGSAFPVGTTTNTFKVTDASGNTATCSFDVVVVDNAPPSITCPSTITATATSPFGAIVMFAAPIGIDNCPGAFTLQTAGLPSGAMFPIGNSSITYKVTDVAGLTNTCTFTVTVNGVPPSIVCPANVNVNAGIGSCSAVATFSATEIIAIPASTITYSIPSGSSFNVGINPVTATATNAYGTSSCTFNVVVNDTQIPTLANPGNSTFNVIANTCAANYTISDPITDNCNGSTWGYTTTGATTLSSGGNSIADGVSSGVLSFNKGVTIVNLTGIDAFGNTAPPTTFTVTVNDNQVPTISGCPSNQSFNVIANTCSASYSIPAPILADNCAGPLTWNAVFSGNSIGNPSNLTGLADGLPSAPVSFNKGTTTVTLIGVDASNNLSSACTFTVTVSDNQAPNITCAGPVTISNTTGLCTGTTTLVTPTVSDNCPLTFGNALNFDGVNDNVNVPNSTSLNLGGAFTYEGWINVQSTTELFPTIASRSASDAIWLQGGVTSHLWTLAARIQGGDIVSTVTVPENTWSHFALTYQSGTAKLYLNGVLQSTISASTPGNGNPLQLGSWVGIGRFFHGSIDELRVWNTARTQAQIASNMNSEISAQTGLVAYYKMNQGIAGGSNGTVTTATDGSGNSNAGSLSGFALSGASSNWVSGPNGITVTNNAPTTFPKGTTTVTWTATDASGNSSTCTQTVTVNDTQAPTLASPGNQTLTTIANTCAADYTIADPITDNCTGATWGYSTTGATTLTSSGNTIADGTSSTVLSFNKGVTIVTLTGIDASSNAATVSTFSVTVNDTQAPTISGCSGDQTIYSSASSCTSDFSIPSPIISDNCGGQLKWNYILSGVTSSSASNINMGTNSSAITFNKGTTNVVLTSVDAAGNLGTTCSFNVIVVDTVKPVITCASNVTISNTTNLCTGTTTLTPPVVTDNCPTILGNGLNFDGVNDQIPTGVALFSSASVTMEAWVKPDLRSDGTAISDFPNNIFSSDNPGGYGRGFGVQVTSSQSGITLEYISGFRYLPYTFVAGNWYHVAVVYTTSSIQTYVNGTLIDNFAVSNSASGVAVTIGKHNDDTGYGTRRFFKGTLDEVRIWNTARTSTQIASAMNTELLGTETGLIKYFKFNQGTASGTNTGLTTATATTGTNATLTNFALTGSTSNWVLGATLGPVVTNNAPSVYPKGNTTVTWTATDASGNVATCSQIVTVNDTQIPTLANPGSASLNVIANTCAANYTIAEPVSDNCTGATWGYSITGATTTSASNLPDNSLGVVVSLNKGTNVITLSGVDAATTPNLASPVTFTITVVDNQAPTISGCPTNQTIYNSSASCSANYSIPSPTISDNCTGQLKWNYTLTGVTTGSASNINMGTNSSSIAFNKGVTNVLLTSVDAVGNTGTTCSFTVTVLDTVKPIITCAPNVTINNTANACTGTTSLTPPTVSDNCVTTALTNGIQLDGSNDYIESSPMATGTGNFTIEFWTKMTGGTSFPVLFGQDQNGVGTPSFRMEVNSGNTLLFTLADATSNVGYFTTGSLPSNTWTHVAVVRSGNTYTTYLNGTASGTGTSGASINLNTNTFNFRIGARRLDAAGNPTNTYNGAFDDFRIWNVARTQPQISSTMNTELVGTETGLIRYYKFNQGLAGANNAGITSVVATTGTNATLNNSALTGTASNWVAGNVSAAGLPSLTNNAPSVYPIGNTTVTWTATDGSGNTSTCNQIVTVLDAQAPVVTCPGNQTLTTTSCTANYTIADPITDNCTNATWTYTLSGATTGASTSIADGNSSPSIPFNIGTTTVTLNGTDGPNVATSCTFTVVVNAPEIDVKGNSVSILDGDITPSLIDHSDFGDVTVGQTLTRTFTIQNTGLVSMTLPSNAISITGPDASYFSLGTLSLPATIPSNGTLNFNVTFNASSIGFKNATINILSNDCDEANFDFSIRGNGDCLPVTITCPGNQTAVTPQSVCNAIVNYSSSATGIPAPTLSYQFTGATTGIGSGHGSGSAFNVGVTHVKLYASNSCSIDSCSFDVTVTSGTSGSSSYTTCNTYTWTNGTTYTTSGSYIHTFSNAQGCDSVHTLNLTIHYSDAISTTVSNMGCYTWSSNNVTYTLSGTYTASFINQYGCDSIRTLNLTITPTVFVAAKAILDGPYVQALGLMSDSLRIQNLIPTTEPYTASPYNKPAIGGPSGETVSSAVLSVTGPDAIVDWVYLELRSSSNPANILATKRALIQRDGDIVSNMDGVSPVKFETVVNGNYYVTIKHRNHLGVMSASPISLSGCSNATFDFTTSSVYTNPSIVNPPRKTVGSISTLWCADANNNKNVKYNGLSSDKDAILNAVGVGTPNNSVNHVYRMEDVNMDGYIKYNNTDNDRLFIINNLGVNTPNNIWSQHTPN